MVDFNDLPAELAEHIIGYHVKQVGINVAWKQQSVCKMFSAYIAHEIVSNQSVKVYRPGRNHRLIDHLLPRILECRASVNNSVPGDLPSVVPKIVYSLMRTTDQSTAKDRADCTKRVCGGIARYASKPHYHTFRPKDKSGTRFTTLTGDEEALCIAIGEGDSDLVNRITQSGVSIYSPTFLVDDVLSFAVAHCCKGELAALIAAAGPAPDGRTRGSQKQMIDARIYGIIRESRPWYDRRNQKPRKIDMVSELMSWYTLNPGASVLKSLGYWFSSCLYMETASEADAVTLFDAIFAHNPPPKIQKIFRDNIGSVRSWSWTRAPILAPAVIMALVPILLREQVFKPKNVDETLGGPQADFPSLLDLAVYSGDAATVELVLDLGAIPNGVLRDLPNPLRSYPLLTAMNKRFVSVVRLLLDKGADPIAGYGTAFHGPPPGHVPWCGVSWDVLADALEAQNESLPYEYLDYDARDRYDPIDWD